MTSELGRFSKPKLAGKTEWAGARRPVTRRSGFNAKSKVYLESASLQGFKVEAGDEVAVAMTVPEVGEKEWVGFGGWFQASADVDTVLQSKNRAVLTNYGSGIWNKFGSLIEGGTADSPRLVVRALEPGVITFYGVLAGKIHHPYLEGARDGLRKNMWQFAPEANFYAPDGPGNVSILENKLAAVLGPEIHLKSCNRCGRVLPVNLDDERATLSFSNHCVAHHRRPCSHASFGRISKVGAQDVVQLDYGFQLECRFCKKFEVNSAHNPQRSADQMKEDGARRRHFELLVDYLYKGSPQLSYSGGSSSLANDVWTRFGGRCFKCGTTLASPRDMHLDHTRPLALLWPLDSTATALCATHNSEKRDRPPSEFYTDDELRRLAVITGIPLGELRDPSPNVEAIKLLGSKLEWFLTDFLSLPQLQKVRDGKLTADLLLKALEKVLAKFPGGAPFRLPPSF